VLGRFRVPVQGPVRGERPMHATRGGGQWSCLKCTSYPSM
jgi:hypothetical protein